MPRDGPPLSEHESAEDGALGHAALRFVSGRRGRHGGAAPDPGVDRHARRADVPLAVRGAGARPDDALPQPGPPLPIRPPLGRPLLRPEARRDRADAERPPHGPARPPPLARSPSRAGRSADEFGGVGRIAVPAAAAGGGEAGGGDALRRALTRGG